MSATLPCLRQTNDGVELDVLVSPRASRSQLSGLHDGRLKVLLAAPPVDGEANLALVEVLAKVFDVPKRDVRLVRGDASRRKTVSISKLALADAAGKLASEAS